MDYNYLQHHGIKGMKWGVRRFRNKNGTLTAAGKKRYSQDDWSSDAKEASALRRKSVNQMSNAELRKYNERVRLEQEYSRLNPSKVKKGMAIAAGVAGTLTTINNLYNSGNSLIANGQKVVNKLRKK